MRNILVTGGCGFIGSNFINYMVEKYPEMNFYNLDILYYCASLDNIKVTNHSNYEFIHGNINDYNLVVYLLKSKNIDTIIHFAAQSHVDNSFLESFKYTEDNVKGTHTLLEAVKNTNLDIMFLHFSTDEVYGESDLNEDPKHEKDILCPTNPYAASKAAAEMIVNSYIHSFNLKAIITRGNNVFGPNQYPEKLIPKFIKHLKNGEKCTIHGDGSSLRSFIHVDDVSTAVECILMNGKIGEIYNIGSDVHNELSVMQVTKLLIGLICNTDDYNKYIEYVKDRPFNDKRYFITNMKLKKLGWEQRISFLDGLKELL
jgi:dTDP-glucose 4,6-dehydratase